MDTFLENKALQKSKLKNIFLIKVGLLIQYFSQKKMKRFDQFSTPKNDFEMNFNMFKEVVHNFEKSDSDII